MLNKKKNNKGFTLVELLVVIAIIGILAVVAVPSLFKQMDKAKATQTVANVKAIQTEIMTEYANASTDAKLIEVMTPDYIKGITGVTTGKLGESYSIDDDENETKVEGLVNIVITCSDNEKANIIGKQLDVTVEKDAKVVKYPVGKK